MLNLGGRSIQMKNPMSLLAWDFSLNPDYSLEFVVRGQNTKKSSI